jgi:DNA-binding transcriptional regulator YdaS (Cro superfamily)/transposase
MKENSLYKAIYNLGSVKDMAKKLGIQREHIYAWIKGVSKVPLEYALQIDYLTGGEIHWKELVPFHVVQRLRHLTLALPKFDLPPCELVYVSIERIHCCSTYRGFTQSENDPLSINKKRPICIDSDNSLIFGDKTLNFYQQHHKRTIPAWRISLTDLAEGHYDQELFVKNFFISERVSVGIALEKFLGKRQGQRNDLKNKSMQMIESMKKEAVSCKLVQHAAQVYLKKGSNLRQLVASRLGFGSHFTYLSAKKIKLYGSELLMRYVDGKSLAISTAARLSKLSLTEQNKILAQKKKDIIKKAFEVNSSYCANKLSVSAQFNPNNEEKHALSNVRCQNLV